MFVTSNKKVIYFALKISTVKNLNQNLNPGNECLRCLYDVAKARVELEQILESQIQVSNRLKDECKTLTEQLRELSEKTRLVVCLKTAEWGMELWNGGRFLSC